MVRTGWIWLTIEQMEGSCEHGNERLDSIGCWDILAQLGVS
jgi:hypothetical protein